MTKLSSFLSRRSRNSLTLWLLAGGYLVYLAYSLLRDAGKTAEHVWGIYLSAAVFGLVGLALLVVSLLAMKQGWYSEKAGSCEDKPAAALSADCTDACESVSNESSAED